MPHMAYRSGMAEDLRKAFDGAFAAPDPAPQDAQGRFLAIVVGDAGYAVSLKEVAVLATARKIVPLPGARQELLGITGHRGAVIPVFDLGALLGHGPSSQCRWQLLCGTRDLVGLAFRELEGQIEGAATAVRRASTEAFTPYVDKILASTPARPVISIAAVVDHIAKLEK